MPTTVFSTYLRQAHVKLDGGERQRILTLSDLPPGQYVVSGQVIGYNADTDAPTQLVCYIGASGDEFGSSTSRLQENRGGGVVDVQTLPLVGEITIGSGGGSIELECQRHGSTGSPVINGGAKRATQIIAMRVAG